MNSLIKQRLSTGSILIVASLLLLAGERNAQGDESVVTAARPRSRTIVVTNREELQQAINSAVPGTRIQLAAGTYRGGLAFANVRGTAELPIVIESRDAQHPPVIEGGTSCLQLSQVAYLELRNLIFSKAGHNGLNIDDGGSIDSPTHHILIQGIVVRDVGTDGNQDGIKLSGVDDFQVERCTISNWGRGGSAIDMVGCHRGEVSHGLFQEGGPNGSGIQMKGGSQDITVRYCRFKNAGGRAINIGGSTGLPYFRPSLPGFEASRITVEDCTFIGSQAAMAFVGVDGARVHHNTIYRPTRWVMRILQETQDPRFISCRNGEFTRNLIAFRADELSTTVNVGVKTAPETFRFAENAWYCLDRPDRTSRLVRLPTTESKGIYTSDPQFRAVETLDLRLDPDSPLQEYGPRPISDETPPGDGTQPAHRSCGVPST